MRSRRWSCLIRPTITSLGLMMVKATASGSVMDLREVARQFLTTGLLRSFENFGLLRRSLSFHGYNFTVNVKTI